MAKNDQSTPYLAPPRQTYKIKISKIDSYQKITSSKVEFENEKELNIFLHSYRDYLMAKRHLHVEILFFPQIDFRGNSCMIEQYGMMH